MSVRTSIGFLRTQIVEAWFFFFVPGVAALLPWTLGWRWLRAWARFNGGPFDEAARAALAVAPQHLEIGNPQKFLAAARLIWLMDYCDLYLSITRWRRGARPWHVTCSGSWPQNGPFIAAGFHFGTCHWVFKTLAAAGHDSTVISVRWDRSEFKKHPMRYQYGRLRYWDMQRLGRLPVAYRPGIKDKLNEALRSGAAVVALIDLPPRMAPRGQRPVRLLDQEVSMPDGVIAIAREAGVPIVPYWVEFESESGTRRFCIGDPLDPTDIQATLQTMAGILDRQIKRSPHAWFFWPEFPQWIAAARTATAEHQSNA